MQKVYFGLGSNMGEREQLISRAFSYLGEFLSDSCIARMYETLPRYVTDQPKFMNTVVSGFSDLPPGKILERVHAIEARLGRNRSREVSKGPRPVDIDILLYGQCLVREADLTIPHPLMKERKFVLIPLLELDPAVRDPETAVPFLEFLKKLEPQGIYYSSLRYYTAIFRNRGQVGTGSGGAADRF